MAKPIMRRLAQETRETVLLTVLNDARDCSICVERIDSQYDLRIHLEVGRQVPLHAGASAKVLLACLPPDEIDGFVQRVGLPKVAPNTITDPDILKENLAEIRRRGYAVSQEETNAGAWGLAVSILDRQRYPVAALGVSAPVSRYSREAEQRFAELTRAATEEIAAITGSGAQTCS
jgi:DNA-binding IclR family transcriptional regulator